MERKQKYNFFKGHWKFVLELNELTDAFSFNGIDKEIKIRENIGIRFLEKIDFDPDPSQEQLNALEFIFENQKELIDCIYLCIIEAIFPLHKSFIEDEEIFFPKIYSSSDISKVLGLDEIIIHNEHKNNTSYTSFVFNHFSADPEHGITITLHKLNYITSGEDWDYREIYKDLNLDYEVKQTQEFEDYKNMRNKYLYYHKPNQKYKTLKEWQKNINRLYPVRLIQNIRNDEFKFFFNENYKLDSSIEIEYLKYLAKQSNNEEILIFLENATK